MHVELRHTKEELAGLIRRENNAKVATRLRAVLMALRGRAHKQIAEDLAVAPRSVQEWIRRYNRGGPEGLKEPPRSGRPKKLTPEQEHQVVSWLERGPDLKRDGVVAWRGSGVAGKIQDAFGKKFSLSGAYALLHRLGYEPLRPRPIHPKADPAAQEAFKNSAPLFSSNSAARIPAGPSRSGSRTRCGTGRRAR